MRTRNDSLVQIILDQHRVIQIIQRKVCKTDNGIHRRADVMRHVRKEHRLCIVCLFSLHKSLFQKLLLFLKFPLLFRNLCVQFHLLCGYIVNEHERKNKADRNSIFTFHHEGCSTTPFAFERTVAVFALIDIRQVQTHKIDVRHVYPSFAELRQDLLAELKNSATVLGNVPITFTFFVNSRFTDTADSIVFEIHIINAKIIFIKLAINIAV